MPSGITIETRENPGQELQDGEIVGATLGNIFTVFGPIDDYPPGYSCLFLNKRLT